MLRSAGELLDVRRPYLSPDTTVELHRIGPASLTLPYRRWHVLTIALVPAAVSRTGGHVDCRGRFHPGEVGIYPAGPGEVIAWPEGFSAIHVHLNPAQFGGAGGTIGLPYLFRTRDRALASMGDALLEVLDARVNPVEARSILHALTARLRDNYADEQSVVAAPRLGRTSLESILGFMDKYASTSIRVTDLAERAELSRFHFTRTFQRIMGLGPAEYLLRRRVELARHMLGEETAGLASVALACGFADQSHLTRAFRAFAGTTPRRFRMQLRSPLHPG